MRPKSVRDVRSPVGVEVTPNGMSEGAGRVNPREVLFSWTALGVTTWRPVRGRA